MADFMMDLETGTNARLENNNFWKLVLCSGRGGALDASLSMGPVLYLIFALKKMADDDAFFPYPGCF